MSLWLMFYYSTDKELQEVPQSFRYHKNLPNDHRYFYEPGQGPLVDLLTEKEHLPKVMDPAILSKIKFISRTEGKHDTKAMLALASELKKQLDTKGDQLLLEMGYDLEWRNSKSKDILSADLDNLISFCEFGVRNKMKQFAHVFQ